jgi:hypothetical protein
MKCNVSRFARLSCQCVVRHALQCIGQHRPHCARQSQAAPIAPDPGADSVGATVKVRQAAIVMAMRPPQNSVKGISGRSGNMSRKRFSTIAGKRRAAPSWNRPTPACLRDLCGSSTSPFACRRMPRRSGEFYLPGHQAARSLLDSRSPEQWSGEVAATGRLYRPPW